MTSPDAPRDFLDRFLKLERAVRQLQTASPLSHASVGKGGIRFYGGGGATFEDSGAAKSGDFVPGVSGWRIAGDSAEFNDLTLRGGIIGNDALTSPVEVAQGNNAGVAFAVPGGEGEVAGFNFTVPAGYTRMICMTSGGVSLINESVNFDYAYARIFIDTFFSDQLFAPATGNNGSCTVSAHKQGLLTGLTEGQLVRVSLRVSTGGGWGANATNRATVVGMATFLR